MSRKAKVPVKLVNNVQAKIKDQCITITGPRGSLSLVFNTEVVVTIENQEIRVEKAENTNKKQFVGLYWSLISNMVKGVNEGFEKKLEMIGVGYRAAVQGKELDIQVGFSHPTKMPIPEGLKVSVEKNTLITIQGNDKQKVGQFAANIRMKRPPEPYKGKGIRYQNEHVRRKAGKTGKK